MLPPDGYELDIAYMARPGAEEIQLELILGYRSNVASIMSWSGLPPLVARAAKIRSNTPSLLQRTKRS